jgi:hypothetical protein
VRQRESGGRSQSTSTTRKTAFAARVVGLQVLYDGIQKLQQGIASEAWQ